MNMPIIAQLEKYQQNLSLTPGLVNGTFPQTIKYFTVLQTDDRIRLCPRVLIID